MKQELFALVVLLIILSLTTFTRTLVYFLFRENVLNLTGKPKEAVAKYIDAVLAIFSVIRILLVFIILNKRGFQHDILTYVLLFLFLSALEGVFYDYSKKFNPQSNITKGLDKIQDVNTVMILASSLYIIKYIFF